MKSGILWHIEKSNIKVGDTVLLQDSNAVRGEWKMGLVTQVFPSEDQKVRRVVVSYKNQRLDEHVIDYKGVKYTNVERPVQRLIVLIAVDDH